MPEFLYTSSGSKETGARMPEGAPFERKPNHQVLTDHLHKRRAEVPKDMRRLPYRLLFPHVDPNLLEIDELFTAGLLERPEFSSLRLVGSSVRQLIRFSPDSLLLTEFYRSLHQQYLDKYGVPDDYLATRAVGPDLDNIVMVKNSEEFGDSFMAYTKTFFETARALLFAHDRETTKVKDNLTDTDKKNKYVEYDMGDGIVFKVEHKAVPTNPAVSYVIIKIMSRQRIDEAHTRDEDIYIHHINVNQTVNSDTAIKDQRFGARQSNIGNMTLSLHTIDGRVVIPKDEIAVLGEQLNLPAYYNIDSVSEPPTKDSEIIVRDDRSRLLHPPESIATGDYRGSISVAERLFDNRGLLHHLGVNKSICFGITKGDNRRPGLRELYQISEKYSNDELINMAAVNPYLSWWLTERDRSIYTIPYFANAKGGAPPWTARSMLLLRDAYHYVTITDPTDPARNKKIVTPVFMRNEKSIMMQANEWKKRGELGLRLFEAGLDNTIPALFFDFYSLDDYDELWLKLFSGDPTVTYKEPIFMFDGEVFNYERWRENYSTVSAYVEELMLMKYKDLTGGDKPLDPEGEGRLREELERIKKSVTDPTKQPWERRAVLDMKQFKLSRLEAELLTNFGVVMRIGSAKCAVLPPAATVEIVGDKNGGGSQSDKLNAKSPALRITVTNTVEERIRSMCKHLLRKSEEFNREFYDMLGRQYTHIEFKDRLTRFSRDTAAALIENHEGGLLRWYPSYGSVLFHPPSYNLLLYLMDLDKYSQAV